MMPWGALTGAVLVVYLLQTAVLGPLGWPWVDLFLTLALVAGFLGPLQDARIAACLIGLVQDLSSIDALGIHAFTLGLVGLTTTAARGMLNLRPLPSRLVVAFICAWPAPLLQRLHLRFWSGAESLGFSEIVFGSGLEALVAAALAAVLAGWQMPRSRRGRMAGFGSAN